MRDCGDDLGVWNFAPDSVKRVRGERISLRCTREVDFVWVNIIRHSNIFLSGPASEQAIVFYAWHFLGVRVP